MRLPPHELKRARDKAGLLVRAQTLLDALDELARYAPHCNIKVTILGETGVGKSLVAHYVHLLSKRSIRGIVKIDCSALPENLIESTLFGHVKGAFSGAVKDCMGLVHDAEGSTLFIDEVQNLSLSLQAKLLHLLQEREYRRVGEKRVRKANVRFIFGANENLEELVRQGKMRQDFYHRLGGTAVTIPPLRERPEDISILANHFLRKITPEKRFSKNALGALRNHDWPGNVRELEETVKKIAALSDYNVIHEQETANSINTSSLTPLPATRENKETSVERQQGVPEAQAKSRPFSDAKSTEQSTVESTNKNRPEKIYQHLSEHGAATKAEIARQIRVTVRTVERAIETLSKNDLVFKYKIGRKTLFECTSSHRNEVTRSDNISATEKKILAILRNNGRSSIPEIGRALQVTPRTASSYIKSLEEIGYVNWVRQGRTSYCELKVGLIGQWPSLEDSPQNVNQRLRTSVQQKPCGPTLHVDLVEAAQPAKAQSDEGAKSDSNRHQVGQTKPSEIINKDSTIGTKSAPSCIINIYQTTFGKAVIRLLQYAQTPRSIAELMDKMRLKDKSKFRSKWIRPLLDASYLKMTIPDKPRSSKQKYVTTEKAIEELNGVVA